MDPHGNSEPIDIEERLVEGMLRSTADAYDWDLDCLVGICARLRDDPVDSGGYIRPSSQLPYSLRCTRLISGVTEHLEPADALRLLESTDPRVLLDRECVLEALLDPFAPLYSLDELADLVEGYVAHRERHRDLLYQTGFPSVAFAASTWLDWHLTPVFPIKDADVGFVSYSGDGPSGDPGPLTSHPLTARRDAAGNPLRAYRWLARPPADEADPQATEQRKPSIRIWGQGEAVPYHQADLLRGLSEEQAKRLTTLRAPFLVLMLDVLQLCAAALREREPATLWPRVFDRLTRDGGRAQIEEHLLIDRAYMGLPQRSTGITALLSLAGHCEKELRLGTLHQTRLRLQPVWEQVQDSGNYFKARALVSPTVLDAALDGYLALEPREHHFWQEFTQRVNTAIEGHVETREVTVTVRLPPELAARFDPVIRPLMELEAARLAATGQLSPTLLGMGGDAADTPAPTAAPEPQYVFQPRGEYWTLVYEGKASTLKDRKGLRYLAVLLSRPGQDVPAPLLAREVDPAQYAAAATLYERFTEEQLAEEGLARGGPSDGEPILNREGQELYRNAIAQLRADLDAARARGKAERAAELQEQLTDLERELKTTVGRRGRSRSFSGEVERARVRVTSAVNDALKSIRDQNESLWRHLENSLTKGRVFRYTPEPPVDWQL